MTTTNEINLEAFTKEILKIVDMDARLIRDWFDTTSETFELDGVSLKTLVDFALCRYKSADSAGIRSKQRVRDMKTITYEDFLKELLALGSTPQGAEDWFDSAVAFGLTEKDTAESLAKLCYEDELSNLPEYAYPIEREEEF